MVDGPHMGAAPGPWDIHCSFTQLFKNEVKKIEVPHTASVRVSYLNNYLNYSCINKLFACYVFMTRRSVV